MTIIYIAGPMSGIKDHNRPLFNMVAAELTEQGSAGAVRTVSGDVECADVTGSVQTVSGDVACGNIAGSVKTVSGDIRRR